MRNLISPKKGSVLEKTFLKIERFEDETEDSLCTCIKKHKTGRINLKTIEKIESFATLTDDNEVLTKRLFEKSKELKFDSVRDLALNFDSKKLEGLFHANQIPKDFPGETQKEKEVAFSNDLEKRIFKIEPTASIQRIVQEKKLKISDKNVESGVVSFLEKHIDFNIKQDSILKKLADPDALFGIKEEHRGEVVIQLKTLQRLAAISPSPKSLEVLANKKVHSASQISQMSEGNFMRRYGKEIGEEEARQVYDTAVAVKIRNEHALMTMRDAIRPTGVDMIDKSMSHRSSRPKSLESDVVPSNGDAAHLDYETLFGATDFCECGHCNSVYSPSAYLVELFQYIRNNNMDPENVHMIVDPQNPSGPKIQRAGYAGTPLEHLFWRRPDLKCLELTCSNAFTILPYIDLSNEIMECYIAHNNNKATTNPPYEIQIELETFNTAEDDESSTLLAQPQNIHKKAYCVLSKAVHPFCLPYHQPIDAIRIYLEHLKTTRYELMKSFRPFADGQTMIGEDIATPATARATTMSQLEELRIDRALCSEYLLMTEEEHAIISKEGFAIKEWYETSNDTTWTDDQYLDEIGVKSLHDYYYHSSDPRTTADLRKVKEVFLPQSGLTYIELVDLLKTFYINPYQPLGEVKNIIDKLNLSYRYLQSFVNDEATDPEEKFGELITFIHRWHHQLQIYYTEHPDPCSGEYTDLGCLNKCDIEKWVYYYFEKIGRLIVLESNDDFQFKFTGKLIQYKSKQELKISKDGSISAAGGHKVAQINADNSVTWFADPGYPYPFFLIINGETIGTIVASTVEDKITGWTFELADSYRQQNSFEIRDTCDISKIKLKHLNGSELESFEWDKMHRFIRFWKKLGWSMTELDQAILGLNSTIETTEPNVDIEACRESQSKDKDDCDCSKLGMPRYTIGILNGDLICKIAKILKVKSTLNISLPNLLCFWTDIETRGDKSLYKRLFLKKNLLALDPVFKADGNGEFLTDTTIKLSDHIPGLMAGLNIKAADITLLNTGLGLNDEMTLTNVSRIYRHQLLSRFLGLKIEDLIIAKELFGDLFGSEQDAVHFLECWQKMEGAGFELKELAYVIHDIDDLKKPINLSQKEQLTLALDIFNGIAQIDSDHADIELLDYSVDVLRTKLALIYDPDVLESIISLVEGTSLYTTNVTAGLNISVDPNITNKITYIDDGPNSRIVIKGIMTAAERAHYDTLSTDSEWQPAITRINSQVQLFFEDTFYALIDDPADRVLLLAGDDLSSNTNVDKGMLILGYYMPFLRTTLKDQLIVDLLTAEVSLNSKSVDNFIRNVLIDDATSGSLLDSFKAIATNIVPLPIGVFNGYVIPSRTDDYTFVVQADTGGAPGTIEFNGEIQILTPLSDPTNVFVSEPISLTAGSINEIKLSGFDADFELLKWKTTSRPSARISNNELIPNHLADNLNDNFKKLQKASLLADTYELSIEEVNFLQAHGSDFSGLDFNIMTFDSWKRLQDYSMVRDALPDNDYTLIDLFHWAHYYSGSIGETEIIDELQRLTQWSDEDIAQYIQRAHFNVLDRDLLKNERAILKMIKAQAVKEKVNVSVDTLFEWGEPRSDFDYTWNVSLDIQKVLRARYALDDWEEIIKPLNDKLRTNQRDTLILYLLNQQALRDWGVIDADSLYEFFLLDVQMESCMETSRIKQAISSTQLFIQRIFLNLEKENIPNDEFDEQRARWEWMSRYRVWEANRKVFLYPENWIRSELRDDKSPFYKELESELLQKDINPEMVKDALKTYLYKLDEVADMKVVGIYVKADSNGDLERIHVVSRTRSAPYFFYYRKYDKGNWYAWEKIQVDIPTYNFEQGSEIISTGEYIIPVEFKSRVFMFYPQFQKKIIQRDHGSKSFDDIQDDKIESKKPREMYEIKMSYTERKSEEWSQKIISEDAIYRGVDFSIDPGPPISVDRDDITEIQKFRFKLEETSSKLNFKIYHNNYDADDDGPFDYLSFDGRKVFKSGPIIYPGYTALDNFQYLISTNTIESVNDASVRYNNNNQQLYFSSGLLFKHDFSSSLLNEISLSDLKTFFDYVNKNRITSNYKKEDFGDYVDDLNRSIFHELKKAYSLYNWEIFFHLPMAVAENLSKNQQFEEALKWYHFVFHPFESGSDGNRFWRFLPFRFTNAQNFLESFFNLLQPNQSNDTITEWRDNPFNPHLIARSRPSAYMKWTVMKYLDNILEWGDYLFRQDTIESVNYASQLYILAGHILGKRPQQIPKRGKVKPQSYLHLMDKLDAFSNATTEMELVFPFSNQVNIAGRRNGEEVVLANMYGLSTTQYFCMPNNPKLMSYWDTFSDRLYKIRHCLNIDGVFRKLSLFEPPIDPSLLVAATAQGLSLSSVLNDLNAPVPNYRFNYMLQKAFELCNEVKSLGNTLLSTKEKKDGEVLSLMRAKHEVAMNNLVMEIKKKQLKEAEKSLDSLYENRKSPVYRMKYYLQQIGEDLAKVPSENTEYSELADKVEAVLDESGLKLINLEKQELDKSSKAAKRQIAIGIVETTAGILSAIPTTDAKGQPLGVGVSVKFGGPHLGAAASAVARAMQTVSSDLSFQSSNAARKAGFTRQLQDRIQQANVAGREIKQIDKQIVTQKIRINMAEQELENHQKQIDNSKEVEEYLKTKYTNEQLYSWMDGQIKSLFYQSYKMAYDLAKKVEGLYRFERGLTSTNFIQYGYWNSARDGLLSGEQLYVGLKQIEMAHQETRAHDYEIPNKQISLRKLNPSALLSLRANGSCEFHIPEELYDLDYAGHYKRRIKSVSFSIPCIAGPYTNISAKAILTEHTFRISKVVSSDYARNVAEDDGRFMTVNAPINAIAMSSAQNDGGLFELNFRDERYMPFEGAGAISGWRLELPDEFRQFDYDTISDVIVHMSYTSCDGGEPMKTAALDNLGNKLSDFESHPQYGLFDLKHDFAQEWYKAMNAPNSSGKHVMELNSLIDRFPYLIKSGSVNVNEIVLYSDSDLSSVELFVDGDSEGTPTSVGNEYKWSDVDLDLINWHFEFDNKEEDRIWMVIGYTI